jgi:hypothetical protein
MNIHCPLMIQGTPWIYCPYRYYTFMVNHLRVIRSNHICIFWRRATARIFEVFLYKQDPR